MSDIVERLRLSARNYADGVAGMEPADHFCWEGAAEIEGLRVENERLRAELKVIANNHWRSADALSEIAAEVLGRAE